MPQRRPAASWQPAIPLLLCLGAMACGDDQPERTTEGLPPPPPDSSTGAMTGDSTATTSGGTEPSTTGQVQACPCDAGRFCAAPYQIGDPPPEAFTCIDQCVPTEAAALWCGDDASCCDPDAECDAMFGICRVEVVTTGAGSTGTTSGGTTDATTSGSSSGSSSGGGIGSSGTTG